MSLESKLLTRFDGVDKELLNLKDTIIKDLQIENNSKKTIIRFVNRKFAKKALVNRKSLKNIDKSSIG